MKIAIDARGANWYKGTGIGTYTNKILQYLIKNDKENNYTLYWSGDNYKRYENSNTNIIMASKKYHNFFEKFYFPSHLEANKIDIFHVPQNGMGLSPDVSCKKIITIHDLIPFVMPETVGKGYLKRFLKEVPKLIDDADGIITVSEWSKKDILKFMPVDENKIFVTPLSADGKYRPLSKKKCQNILMKKYNITKPFILYIGGFSPRKNVKSLICSFTKIYNDLSKEYNLVIVGASKDELSYLNDFSNNLDLSSKIIFTGFVPENMLPILYNGCDVFVYPSFYEGFGLPPLEAMCCGAPVITSNISSIPEVVKDAGILINPYSSDSLMEAMVKVLNNDELKSSLKENGLKRALDFSWDKTAIETLKAYKNVYEKPTLK